MKRLLTALHRTVTTLEFLVAAGLVIVAALGGVWIVWEVVANLGEHPYLTAEQITRLLDGVLVVFIVVELFHIAVAYMNKRNVIPTVLEASLVAVARKLLVFEGGEASLEKGATLALLLAAVALAWWLLDRASALGSAGESSA